MKSIQPKQVAGIVPISTLPSAMAFGNPAGTALTADSLLTAAPPDAFGRPQIWDNRNDAGTGAVYRQGSWQTDGDPTNQAAEGIVLYGANALGVGPTGGAGGYGRLKPRRFGLAQIIPGVNGNNLFYYFRVDSDSINGMSLTDDTDTTQFFIDRTTGTVQVGSPDPTNGGKGQWFLNQTGPLGGSTSPVQMSYASKSLGFRLAQYGAGARTANFGFFRSRGVNIGDLAACIDGDSLMNFTCSGVTGNGLNVPLAGIFDCVIPVGGVFATTITPDFRWQLAGGGGINSRRVVWFMQGATGDLIMAPKAAASTQEERIRIRDAQASAGVSANAMQGLATTGAGGTVVVANTLITANTRITLTWQDGGAVAGGTPAVATRTPGTDFTIQSTVPLDVGCTVFWQLWEPAP